MNISRDQDLLRVARLTINNGQRDEEAQALLLRQDFGPDQWQLGRELVQRVDQLLRQRQEQQDARWALSQQIEESVSAITEQLKEHAPVARVALRHDPTLLRSLRIDRISTRRWDAIRQAAHFYEQLEAKKLALQPFGITAREVRQVLTDISTLLERQEERVHLSGRSQQSTQERQAALTDLRAWLIDFREVARLAFRRQPQLREIFSIRVRSSARRSSVPAGVPAPGGEASLPTGGGTINL